MKALIPILVILLASGCAAPTLETRLGAPCGHATRAPRLEGNATRLPDGILDCALPVLELPPSTGFGSTEDRGRLAQALKEFRLEPSLLGRGADRLRFVDAESAPWRMELQVLSLEVARGYRFPSASSSLAEHTYRLELRCRLVERASGQSPWGCSRVVEARVPLSYPPDPTHFQVLLRRALRDCGRALATANPT